MHAIQVADASAVGHARRRATDIARAAGFGDTDLGRVGIVVTEAASNLVKHAGGGELLVEARRRAGRDPVVAILALDSGPGLQNPAQAMHDGFSSSGTPGTGLGAIRRQSTIFDLYSAPGQGLAVLAIVGGEASNGKSRFEVGGVNVAYPGEEISGDAWSVTCSNGHFLAMLADGLGHGIFAAEAARLAQDSFRRHAALVPSRILERAHGELRATRGAAAAVVQVDPAGGHVRFAGVGNIAATIVTDGQVRHLVSHHGTLGHDARTIQEFTYPWSADSLLVLHSDGLGSRWQLERYPGLALRHPLLVAGVLYRDFRRSRDDVSVVVARESA